MSIRDEVIRALTDICREQEVECDSAPGDELVLLTAGLDSMGYAILVSELDMRLGYDPFVLMDVPVYPKTLGEFVAIYEQFKDAQTRG